MTRKESHLKKLPQDPPPSSVSLDSSEAQEHAEALERYADSIRHSSIPAHEAREDGVRAALLAAIRSLDGDEPDWAASDLVAAVRAVQINPRKNLPVGLLDGVSASPEIRGGAACVVGTRLAVVDVLRELLVRSAPEVLMRHHELSMRSLTACLEFGAAVLRAGAGTSA